MRRLILILSSLSLAGSVVPAQEPNAAQLDRYAQEAQRALAEKRYDDAARAFEKLRELSPLTAEVHAQLGAVYFQQHAFDKAVPTLRQAQKLRPGLPNVDVLLALCLSEMGQFKEALPGLRKAFKQTADDPLRRLGGLQLERVYTGLEQDDKAVEVALELSRLYPDDPEVLYHGGRLFANFAYLQTMKLRKAAPESVFMHQAAGEANESQGYYEAAIREYREVLALAPARPGIHFRIGRALLLRAKPLSGADASGARTEAMKEFEEELRVDATSANAAYELGEIHRQSGEMEKAAAFFARALEHYPDFDEAQIGLGRVLMTLGKPAQALPHLQRAVSLNPGSDVGYYQLAQCHRVLGNEAEQSKALAAYQRLRSQQSNDSSLTAPVPTEVTRQEMDAKPGPQ
jgi:tetratricopeptide (TPR) repeat protein